MNRASPMLRHLAMALAVVLAGLMGSARVARAQFECLTCFNQCDGAFTQCLASCPPPNTLFGQRCENRCELNQTLCLFKCQDTVCLVGGAGLSGFWEELIQICKGTGGNLRCSLKGTFVVFNPGTETAPNSTLLFVLSTDATLDPEDTTLKRVAVGALQPGEEKTRHLSVNLPDEVSASGMYILAVLDAEGDVLEANEQNNIVPQFIP